MIWIRIREAQKRTYGSYQIRNTAKQKDRQTWLKSGVEALEWGTVAPPTISRLIRSTTAGEKKVGQCSIKGSQGLDCSFKLFWMRKTKPTKLATQLGRPKILRKFRHVSRCLNFDTIHKKAIEDIRFLIFNAEIIWSTGIIKTRKLGSLAGWLLAMLVVRLLATKALKVRIQTSHNNQ